MGGLRALPTSTGTQTYGQDAQGTLTPSDVQPLHPYEWAGHTLGGFFQVARQGPLSLHLGPAEQAPSRLKTATSSS